MNGALSPSVRGLARALARNAPRPDWPPSRHRSTFEQAASTRPLPPSVTIEPVRMGGLDAEWHLPAERRSAQIVVYLHGGGFIMGSPATTRPTAAHLAAATGRRVLVVDYPLAPESPFPAQPDAALAAVRALLDDRPAGTRLVLAGDSAGGALALGAERALHRTGRGDAVAALVLLSPLLDLRLVAASIDANAATDPQLPRWLLEQMVDAYRGPGADPADPAVSAVLGPLDGLAPTLVQSSPQEGLADDARLLAARAGAAGGGVEVQWWDGMIHVWHQFAPRLPEANDALAAVGSFLDAVAS